MTFDEAIKGRRSVRRYLPKRVSDDDLEELIELARHAPSSMDGQPWCFIVVREQELKDKLVDVKNSHVPADKTAFPADFISAAAAVVAVCVDRTRSHRRERENGILATAYLLLAAHARGLAGVYLSAYSSEDGTLADEIADLLGLPDHIIPITLVPIGVPAELAATKPMRPIGELIHHDRYNPTVRLSD